VIGKNVSRWMIQEIVSLAAGLIIAYFITIITPVSGYNNLPYIFLAGAIAVSALILPGISGSFMLLLMGIYTLIIPTIKEVIQFWQLDQIIILLVFGAGCLLGLMTFSRVLSWMFKHYHDLTLALLTGFMIGSLNKIWPWRNPTLWINDSGEILKTPTGAIENLKVISETNVLPSGYQYGDPNTLYVILASVAGLVLVFLVEKWID
jgi:putative membrane protein